jgi:hypothetical protein
MTRDSLTQLRKYIFVLRSDNDSTKKDKLATKQVQDKGKIIANKQIKIDWRSIVHLI